jgi:hypothetical protein
MIQSQLETKMFDKIVERARTNRPGLHLMSMGKKHFDIIEVVEIGDGDVNNNLLFCTFQIAHSLTYVSFDRIKLRLFIELSRKLDNGK